MRTTLTLDSDVAAELARLRRREARSFKALVNEVLRRGLRQISEEPSRRDAKRFRTRAVTLGRPSIALDNVAEAVAIAEAEDHG